MMAYSEIIGNLRNRFAGVTSLVTTNRTVAVLSLTAAISFAGAVYFYAQWNSLQNDPQTSLRAAVDETSKLVADVGQLLVLPEGETPTIATVSDLEKLKSQPFFVNAKNGDKVLIYTNAKKAILYDPIAHKIVEVAPINIGPSVTPSFGQ